MSLIISEINKQASENTKYHCLYDYFFLGYTVNHLAKIYNKNCKTIRRWIHRYKEKGCVQRKEMESTNQKFSKEHQDWLISLYKEKPILHLKEAINLFFQRFGLSISASSVSRILHNGGMTWKVVERRAIQLHLSDVLRFANELRSIPWLLDNLVFLDEVSFDNRDMLRKQGYGVVGERLIYRGEFNRKSRISLLCFLGINGIIDAFSTEGTFNRTKFAAACRQLATQIGSPIRKYPGLYSIWILDGARIHCDPNIVTYLRSLGIIPIFLPAYAPFLNPIEVVFGLQKRMMKQNYRESKDDPQICIAETINRFMGKDMTSLFRKCGYVQNGRFDPAIGLEQAKEFLK